MRTVDVPVSPNASRRSRRADESGELKILLERGTGLKAADMNGKSDPYVIATCGGKAEKKSRTVKGTLNPAWNEELTFTGMLQEFTRTGLTLKVFDWDSKLKLKSKDDPLGGLQVPLEFLMHQEEREFSEALPTQGSLQFKVTWVPLPPHLLQSGTLHVYLDKGVDLKSMDSNGKSDPYVKLTINGKEKKSKTIKKTLNPVWDESFQWSGVLRDLIAAPMSLVAMDYDFMSKDDPLGAVSVPLAALADSKIHTPVVQLPEKGSIHLKCYWQVNGAAPPPDTFARPSQSSPPNFVDGAAKQTSPPPPPAAVVQRAEASPAPAWRRQPLRQRPPAWRASILRARAMRRRRLSGACSGA